MFKKLKQQKINEEQLPQRNAQSPQQAQVGIGVVKLSCSNYVMVARAETSILICLAS